MNEIETEFDNKNSNVCSQCKEVMIGKNCIGKSQCLNFDCFKNNNPRHYCVCEHMKTLHENLLGVCRVKDCNCEGWDFLCTEQVYDAWNTKTQESQS